MKIGIIGSSFAGLVAGKKLALAGHDVKVFEQSSNVGFRLASKKTENGFFDYGMPFIEAQGDEFGDFIDSLKEKGILFDWASLFKFYDGKKMHEGNPNRDRNMGPYYASKNGLNAVADYLKRWVDIETSLRVGGLTHYGPNRSKKRSWMVNLTNINVFECDAVILATDAVNAYGMLNTTQNATISRRLSRFIDEVAYKARYSLMVSTGGEVPEWKGIECSDSDLTWIGNDTSKRESEESVQLTIQSSDSFARAHQHADKESIVEDLLATASEVMGQSLSPDEKYLHHWNFFEAQQTFDDYFMEMEMKEAPLALVGDYFNDATLESAYRSGLYLAEYWIDKFEDEVDAKVKLSTT